MQTKQHALSCHNGPGICGAGQGQKALQRVVGKPIDELMFVDNFSEVVTCKRCLRLLRRRFPMWFDVATLSMVKRD
jgi:hypothetical protein